ncbi:MAG: hypothetical protein K9K82_02735 [Desulfobacteraceae bacterium]|nr:hypothetical protein [Desulfobacteraceae bacterium]
MKRIFIFALALIFLVAGAGLVFAQMERRGDEHMSRQQQFEQHQYPERGQGWFCPWCGDSAGYERGPGMMYGPGMMRGPGMMYGPGMMRGPGMMYGRGGMYGPYMPRGGGPGMMYGPGMMRGQGIPYGWGGAGPPEQQPRYTEELSQEDAGRLMQRYVAPNPNLKVGEITEKDDEYIGEVVTKDGSLVEKLVVDKETGLMKSTY